MFRDHLFFAKPVARKTFSSFVLIGHFNGIVDIHMGLAFQFVGRSACDHISDIITKYFFFLGGEDFYLLALFMLEYYCEWIISLNE